MDTPSSSLARAAAVGLASLAGGCYGYEVGCYRPWSQFGGFWSADSDAHAIPVDAAPWLLRPCGHPTPEDCALVIDGVRVPVEFDNVGGDACDLGYYDQLSQGRPTVIQTLRPGEALPPGATATLDCDADDNRYTAEYYDSSGYYSYSQFEPIPRLRIRNDAVPAAPPGSLADLAVHYTRGDPNICAGDYLALDVDFDAPFLREGGYIEAVYPNGQVIAIHEPHADGLAWLPGTRGPLTLTPVAIDGQRGEPVRIDEGDMTADAVYIPGCSVDPAPRASGLLALLWLLAVRRRRRST